MVASLWPLYDPNTGEPPPTPSGAEFAFSIYLLKIPFATWRLSIVTQLLFYQEGGKHVPQLPFAEVFFSYLLFPCWFLFLGACTFIIACLIFAMANAPFGSRLKFYSVDSICHCRQKRLQRRRPGAWVVAPRPRPRRLGVLGCGSGLGWELHCCCCSAFAWLIALLACLLRLLGWLRWSPFLFGFCG